MEKKEDQEKVENICRVILEDFTKRDGTRRKRLEEARKAGQSCTHFANEDDFPPEIRNPFGSFQRWLHHSGEASAQKHGLSIDWSSNVSFLQQHPDNQEFNIEVCYTAKKRAEMDER